MLFVTMDEIYKRAESSNIYFLTVSNESFDNYRFITVYNSDEAKKIALDDRVMISKIKAIFKDIVKTLLGKRYNLWRFNELKRIMPSIDLIVDVSGFNIGKRWPVNIQEAYLDNIRLARKYRVPIVLMPQSFGPFDYSEDKSFLISEISELLPYAKTIFAREIDGYLMLSDTFHLNNLAKSSDMVLQNKGINLKNIFVNTPDLVLPEINEHSIGIIPNTQCFRHGDPNVLFDLYKRLVERLFTQNKDIYIFRHSVEDIDLCRDLYNVCNMSTKVHLIDADFSCIEFDAFIKSFDFVICSRYHGIVHSYRNHVPCVLLGWSSKYKSLAELLNQQQYFFDITDKNTSIDDIISAIDVMCDNKNLEVETIREKLSSIQENNCFDLVFNDIR